MSHTGTLEAATPSDSALIAEASVGSTEAFDQLYDRYCARAYRLALAVCRDHAHAGDAVQEAFLSIWKSTASYRLQRGSVAAWVLTVVRHRAIDHARRNGVTTAWQGDCSDLNNHAAVDDVREQAVLHEQADHMCTLLNQLPDALHEVITLAYYGQLTHTEIAKQLDLPTETVKGRMRLGMHKLRANMERHNA